MTVNKQKGDIMTKRSFKDYQLHIEWMIPENITGEGQGRGNSGVYMQNKYEIQILDSYNSETYVNGQAGSIYKQSPPLVNSMRKPGEWNVYDIIYKAPTFTKEGKYRTYPTVTVIHNGVVVQNNATIIGTTEYIGFPKVAPHGDGPILLQSHGDQVSLSASEISGSGSYKPVTVPCRHFYPFIIVGIKIFANDSEFPDNL